MSDDITLGHKLSQCDTIQLVSRIYLSSNLDTILKQYYLDCYAQYSDHPLETYFDFGLRMVGAYNNGLNDDDKGLNSVYHNNQREENTDKCQIISQNSSSKTYLRHRSCPICRPSTEEERGNGIIVLSGKDKRRIGYFNLFYKCIDYLTLTHEFLGIIHSSPYSYFSAGQYALGRTRSAQMLMSFLFFGNSFAVTSKFKKTSSQFGYTNHLEPLISCRQAAIEGRTISFDVRGRAKSIKSRVSFVIIYSPLILIVVMIYSLVTQLDFSADTSTTGGQKPPEVIHSYNNSTHNDTRKPKVVTKESTLLWFMVYAIWAGISMARLYLYVYYFYVICSILVDEIRKINIELNRLVSQLASGLSTNSIVDNNHVSFDSSQSRPQYYNTHESSSFTADIDIVYLDRRVKSNNSGHFGRLDSKHCNQLISLYLRYCELCEIIHKSDKFWSDIFEYYWLGGTLCLGLTLFFLFYVRVDSTAIFNFMFITFCLLALTSKLAFVSVKLSNQVRTDKFNRLLTDYTKQTEQNCYYLLSTSLGVRPDRGP